MKDKCCLIQIIKIEDNISMHNAIFLLNNISIYQIWKTLQIPFESLGLIVVSCGAV